MSTCLLFYTEYNLKSLDIKVPARGFASIDQFDISLLCDTSDISVITFNLNVWGEGVPQWLGIYLAYVRLWIQSAAPPKGRGRDCAQ